MRNFLMGVIIALVALALVVLGSAFLGFMPTSADATPPGLERRIALGAMDASMERHAPRASNPVPPTDANLIDGMRIYTMNCALCHGSLDRKPSSFQSSFYPPPPQLILDPLDDPEWHIFYAIRTGIRYTGMPAWNKALSEEDMWKVTGFLSRIEKLPPGAREYWQKAFAVSLETPGGSKQHGDKNKD
jgi:mono/diheme cytochrome c family protein